MDSYDTGNLTIRFSIQGSYEWEDEEIYLIVPASTLWEPDPKALIAKLIKELRQKKEIEKERQRLALLNEKKQNLTDQIENATLRLQALEETI